MNRCWLFLFCFFSGLFASESASWSSFRGPACGVAAFDNAPTTWDGASGSGVLWKTPLKMVGVSSPIVWGNRLFLTEGNDKERALLAFEADSGRLLWRQVVADGGGDLPLPPVNETGLAMPTPVCDASGVYALFGTGDLAAFTLTGEKKWQIFLQRPTLGYGFSSSPVLVGDLLAVQFDDLHQGRILGIDAATGTIRWQKERSRGASWSSPFVIPGSEVFVVNANGSATAFTKDGSVLWDEDGVTGQVTPSPAWWNHRLFLVNGMAGMISYDLSTSPKVAWKYKKSLTDVASPVVVQGLVFMATSSGRIDCLDAITGTEVWSHQGPGCHSSLVASGERIYALGRDGTMLVFAAERQYRELAKNRLGDACDATPAIGRGRMWIRGRSHLWCLGTVEAEAENRKKYNDTGSFGAHLQAPQLVTRDAPEGIELTATVPLLGGCCFTLTSKNLAANLQVPPGITILSGPIPATYSALEAPVSGTAKVSAVFRWVLQRQDPGTEYPLTLSVTSSNSDPVTATQVLGATVSLRLKGPNLPQSLPLHQEIPIAVDVQCTDENRFVKGVVLLYSTEVPPGAKPDKTPPDQAKRGLLACTLEGKSIFVPAKSLVLQRKYEPTIWYGSIPAQTQGPLYAMAVATDDTGVVALGTLLVSDGVPKTPARSSDVEPRWGLLFAAGICFVLACILVWVRWRRKGSSAQGKFLILALFVLGMILGGIGLFSRKSSSLSAPEISSGYPQDSSTLVALFLDSSEASKQLSEQVEVIRAANPHRIHVLSFVAGLTPETLCADYKKRWGVNRTPSIVLDGKCLKNIPSGDDLRTEIQKALEKPPSRLSMELRDGLGGSQQITSGFIMCNHSPRPNAVGKVSAFAVEKFVRIGSWQGRYLVRQVLAQDRSFAIPAGKCQAPLIMRGELPSGVNPAQISTITVIVDEAGNLIDAICTEKPCSRTGVCG